ncbi:hypothetical protein VHEMI04494 [[Torrubiella] hemipterigena]|uniref:2EXR domain-containing protein n=1 Tax=[Torrubiella] hemipterigena TaxID=1531966 RepID=A0A0A1T1G5_9HYPO|nr:hypothetical protein VHEMI04494 [[Torrubiella] hemipterigena]
METFPLFSRLPTELRLAIWSQAIHPISLLLISVRNDPEVQSLDKLCLEQPSRLTTEHEVDNPELDSEQSSEESLEIEDNSTLLYRPIINPPLQACRESFALMPTLGEWNTLGDTLPVWFVPELDVVRGTHGATRQIWRYPLGKIMENLVVFVEDAEDFFFGREFGEGMMFNMITDLFSCLKSVIIESKDSRQLEQGKIPEYWLEDYVDNLVEYFWPEDDDRTFVIDIQLINYAHPKEEWMTRANCLRVWHNWEKKRVHFWRLYWGTTDDVCEEAEYDPKNINHAILESDDELDDPGLWLRKRRPFDNF